MNITLHVDKKGMDRFTHGYSIIEEEIEHALGEWIRDVKAESEPEVPLKTGKLKSGFYSKVAGSNAKIGYHAFAKKGYDYAHLQHDVPHQDARYGHPVKHPHGKNYYLRDPVLKNQHKFNDMVRIRVKRRFS